MPTTSPPGPACSIPAHEPMLSARAQVAPPCSSPNGCSLPAPGMVATSRAGGERVGVEVGDPDAQLVVQGALGVLWQPVGARGGHLGTVTSAREPGAARPEDRRCPHLGSLPMSAPVSTSAPAPAPVSAGPRPRLLLLDGHSLAYRAFFALPVENFSTTTGQPTNAVYGFTSMLINVLRDEQPTHLAVAFDVSRKTFRSEIYAEYKANRSESSTDFRGQLTLIQEVLDALRVTTVER